MAPLSSQSTGNAAAPGLSTAPSRPGPRVWEALPAIAYGFVIYPLTPSKPLRRQSRLATSSNGGHHVGPNGLHTLREETENELQYEDAFEYSEQATLEIGDEVYAFERLAAESRNGPVWYRG
jgi:dedicator of cytokinesis protein 3